MLEVLHSNQAISVYPRPPAHQLDDRPRHRPYSQAGPSAGPAAGSAGPSSDDAPRGALRRLKKKGAVRKPDCLGQPLGPNEQDNKAIGNTIFKILRGEMPLIKDSTGQVLLGNDVWVKRKDWDAACSADRKLSLRMHSLVSCIWDIRQCAGLSVVGGVSPKTPHAAVKPAAPPGPLEAILGFYRAQMMLSGDHTTSELDLIVEKDGKNLIRSKFQNAVKKLRRERAIVKERISKA